MLQRNVRLSAICAMILSARVAASTLAHAEQQPDPRPPCATPEHRQFDFWLGTWDVRTPDGKRAGANTIRLTLSGCVLQENWQGAGGHSGTSYNIYDAPRKRWHQTWVDDQGQLLQLDGTYADGKMVLVGETVDSTGHATKQRITWQRMDGGRVRQRWDSSSDGVTWQVVFDGIYSPVKP